MEHIADLNAAIHQIVAGRQDIGDDQVQALGRTGCRRGDVLAEDNRATGARGRELNHAEVVTTVEVCVEAPPEPGVELLRAVDVQDGDDDHLELRGGCRDACVLGRVLAANAGRRCRRFSY